MNTGRKSKMEALSILLWCLLASLSISHSTTWTRVETEYNQGWANYLADEPSEYHNLPLSWELNTSLPAWLQGSYVKMGQARGSLEMTATTALTWIAEESCTSSRSKGSKSPSAGG
jgi:outer membrane receptor for ferrienterochelin and colicin